LTNQLPIIADPNSANATHIDQGSEIPFAFFEDIF